MKKETDELRELFPGFIMKCLTWKSYIQKQLNIKLILLNLFSNNYVLNTLF